MDVEFQKIEDRTVNIVNVVINVESGCDWRLGEYSLYITGFIGALDLHSVGGVDDVSLIKDCIENNLEAIFSGAENQVDICVVLEEGGEWDGFSWHKYYNVRRINF